MKHYIKVTFWEWFLCTLTASGMAINIFNGYEMRDHLSGNLPAILLIMAGIQVILFMIPYNRGTIYAGIAGIVILAAVGIAYNQIHHPFLAEETESNGIFWMMMLMIGILIWVITRIRRGRFMLFAAGNLVIAAEVFLEFGLNLPGYILFLCGSAGIIFIKNYKQSLGSSISGQMQMLRYMIQIAGTCAVAMALAILIAVMILEPLQLKTQEIKLIEQLQSMEVVHKVGMSMILPELNEDWQSDQEPDDQTTTDQPPEADDSSEQNGAESEPNETEEPSDDDQGGENNNEQQEQQLKSQDQEETTPAHAVKYDTRDWTWLFILIAVIAAILAPILIHKRRRKVWFQKIQAMPREEGVLVLYQYFLKVLSLVKIRRREGLTLKEFARTSRKLTEAYIYGDYDFQTLTGIYEKVYYGNKDVTEEEWKMFEEAYQELHANLLDEVGKWRYIRFFYFI